MVLNRYYTGIILLLNLVIVSCELKTKIKQNEPINRKELVTRHNIIWPWEERGLIPMGNGEFCIGVDGTGLQTFCGNTMSHWGWHSFPLPKGVTSDQIPATGSFINVNKGERYIGSDTVPTGKQAIANWMYDNPHIFNLGRLRFVRFDGVALTVEDITSNGNRSLDLWTGTHTAKFVVSGDWINNSGWINPVEMGRSGQQVIVTTYVDPDNDQVSVRVESELISKGILKVAIDFPYPTLNNETDWVGDFGRTEGNYTSLREISDVRSDFNREVDDFTYNVAVTYTKGAKLNFSNYKGCPVWYLESKGLSTLEFSTVYSQEPIGKEIADFETTKQDNKTYWENFWMHGGAIDLSESEDPRWYELERRIVLSQYLTAVQSSGSWPSSESGLMNIDPWRGQFHFEIIFFHQAHYALWNRWDMTDKAVQAYQRFIPTARARAQQFGFDGLEWPKSASPSGRSAPWEGNQALLWKQPQPLLFAELEYRLKPTPETLEKWSEVVFGTVKYMVDFLTLDKKTNTYHIELNMSHGEWGSSSDNPQVLAFWHWGLEQAQIWRERMDLTRDAHWDEVLEHLVTFKIKDKIYVDSQDKPLHLTNILGLIPPSKAFTLETATSTYAKMKALSNHSDDGAYGSRNMGWGVAMSAVGKAKMGDPSGAVDALLGGLGFAFDQAGINRGLGGAYLPTNGALLYAVAVMAEGWDGAPDRNAPGFPDDGTWVVKTEGLIKAP